ncbi:hypothetical protein [Lacipirellula sp.]|uniref:hypothetical protein n=1 Tax=Lacipirellula sp. TaxID=2691419 RepID=UPI003D140D6D
MFSFVVYQSPDGWSVATVTTIVCHNVDELTAKRLTRKALDLPKALINEAFRAPSDVLTWRATFQQATAATLAELNEAVEDIADVTAEELADLHEAVEFLNEVTAEQAREQDLTKLHRQLATLQQRFDAAVVRSLEIINKPSHGPNMRRENRLMVIAATWDTELGERIRELRNRLT